MDGSSFDRLAQTFASGHSRRNIIKSLGASAVGALGLAGTGLGVAADGCKGTGKACSKGSQCCSGNCTPSPGKTSVSGSNGICCPAGQIQNSAGTCAPACTPSTCAELGAHCGSVSDGCGGMLNCGGCGTCQTCGPDYTCVALSTCEHTVERGCNGTTSCFCDVTTEGVGLCTDANSILYGGNCGECFSSAQCAELYPDVPGVVCIAASETGCCAPSLFGGGGYCSAPCPV